jgi:hypothetical protein
MSYARLFAATTSLPFVMRVFLCAMGGIIFAYYEDNFVELFMMSMTTRPARWRRWWLAGIVKMLFCSLKSILYTSLSFLFVILFL